MTSGTFKAVLFDIDGTLLVASRASRIAIEAALEDQFGIKEKLPKMDFSGRTDHAIFGEILSYFEESVSDEKRRRLYRSYVDRLDQVMSHEHARLLPSALEVVEVFASQGICLGIITGNMKDAAIIKLGHFGLWDFFEIGAFGDSVSCRNQLAEEALVTLQGYFQQKQQPLELSEVLMVGDTPKDVACARHIGVPVAAITTGTFSRVQLQEVDLDYLIDHLDELVPILGY